MPSLATAQQPHPAAVGDLMTALVQPRHIKLGLAGNEQNLPYAAYELDQLRETFADLAEILPKYRDSSIPDLIRSTVTQPLAALDRAIQANWTAPLVEPSASSRAISIRSCHGPRGLCHRNRIERGQWAAYHEPCLSFHIAAIAFRPRSFSTRCILFLPAAMPMQTFLCCHRNTVSGDRLTSDGRILATD